VTINLFAGARVRDFAVARPWYEQLLGEVAFMAHDTEAVWMLADHRFVYVVEDPDRAGGAAITIFTDDLDETVAEIASRGLEPSEVETYGNGVRKTTYRDPDGNEIGFGGPPA
jgi:hypothetical protein